MKANSVKLICPDRHYDKRGFFLETYNRRKYLEYGIYDEFVQDNHSLSRELGTLRGLHFQSPPHAQAKLVRCIRGSIFDVAVDIRKGSPTFGKWEGYNLTFDNCYQLYVPIGFAHGFITLETDSEVIYKCSNHYSPKSEFSISWKDPDIGVDWPFNKTPITNSKDAKAQLLKDIESPFIYGVNS
ncbi:dTDP-4-dehydrorhamnose 3,5-epimerase [Paracoccaceae bacterium]|nr:dTDP-4-dehydrorhamnose 3,5-epimerase [Paracoccaceae bacterium]